MGRLRSAESRQAQHDAAVLRDLRLCVDDKGRLDLTAIPPGRRGRLMRHINDTHRMQAATRAAEKEEKANG